MKMTHILTILSCAAALGACSTTVPAELVNARAANQSSSEGPAAQLAPAELHVASLALAAAEKSFRDDPDSYRTRDLAYIAQRRAQLADATASIIAQKRGQTDANKAFQDTQGKIVKKTKAELDAARAALSSADQRADAEKAARVAAEARAAAAQAALARLAAVKAEPRGMVITLSGSVLFASNRSALLPEAKTKLNQVAEVLLTTRERNLTIEGHTDSQGSDAHNMELSQSRADAVRTYLIERGYEADLVKAQGLGEGRPIADNGSAEGRANNRRVEIVIQPEAHTSNP